MVAPRTDGDNRDKPRPPDSPLLDSRRQMVNFEKRLSRVEATLYTPRWRRLWAWLTSRRARP
jgi:hypothetical protein